MPKNVPTPVAAAVGIVPTVVDSVRRLPGKAVQIPVLAISTALGALETARRDYTELAERGERVISRLRGGSLDGLEDWAESLVEQTPLATPYDAVEDKVEDAVSKVTELLDRAADKKPAAPKKAAAQEPKGEPTPAAPTGSPAPVETAASADVVATVEAVAAATDVPSITAHDDLPLADYDHMTLGSLRGRLRSLSIDELVQVRDYEKAHAHRLPVVTLLDNRIAKLATEADATPSAGGGEVVTPAAVPQPKVTKAAPSKTAVPRTKVRKT
ncbi:MAG: hypothetical protein JWO12_3589 [Frankiales bacterium]|nr:hypothetical protein [Frankiales bacterium]